ncbi:MAG: hypothetical protein ACK4MV_08870 [Beijerinckiaceae bacterium]
MQPLDIRQRQFLYLAIGLSAAIIVGHPWLLAWLLIADPDEAERRRMANSAFPNAWSIAAIGPDGSPANVSGKELREIEPGVCLRRTTTSSAGRSSRSNFLYTARVTHECRYSVLDSRGRRLTIALIRDRWPYAAPEGADERPVPAAERQLSEILKQSGS